MLDHDHGRAVLHETVEHPDQCAHIERVQADGMSLTSYFASPTAMLISSGDETERSVPGTGRRRSSCDPV